jgi:molybdate transport system substrate-binding protein
MSMTSRSYTSIALVLAALGVGCGRTEPTSRQEEQVVVFAAASLRDVFEAMEGSFERAHPGVDVTFHFAGTQELRTQLEQGAAADVFASADLRHMDELVRAALVKAPAIFARNEPVLVVSSDAGDTLRSLADLPNASRIVLGTPEVPIGKYSLQILNRARATLGEDFPARVEAKVVSREMNVRQVLAKVSLGEAQAGVVYRTDVPAAQGNVSVVSIPTEVNVIADYPIGVVTAAAHRDMATEWVRFVLSTEGQGVLTRAGFEPAPGSASR